MAKIIPRSITRSIRAQQSKYPILGITGPRQSGKTTLLRHTFKDYAYVSLEDPDIRSFATEDPKAFLKKYDSHVIFDEAQRAPELFSYIQTIVDTSQHMGQFILSGSQNFHLMNSITQTLAGRVALFKLLPLDFGELKSESLLSSTYAAAAVRGFYPAIFDRDIESSVFYSNYVNTYLEKDVAELMNVRDMNTFRTFIALCASRAGQLLNLSALANECNISQPTAKSWFSFLESSYIVFLLQPYYENFNKRLVKTPKLYFYDTGLLCHLLTIRTAEDLEGNRVKGNIFENMVIAEYHKKNFHHYLHQQYYFWQDSNKHEIDLLMKTAKGFDILEVKASQTIKSEFFGNMDFFEAIADNVKIKKTLVYGGSENQKRTKYNILSWQNINP